MRIGAGLAATCWMAVVPGAMADDPLAMPDPTAQDGMPEPGAPDSISQTENAGFATLSTSSESHSSHESGKHHSSDSSFGIAFGMPGMTPAAAAMPVWLFQAGQHHHHGSNRGSSCTAPQNHQCRGCSISCPADQAAHCEQGDRGIFTEETSGICQREAKCECQ
jgi:hypothetical protein